MPDGARREHLEQFDDLADFPPLLRILNMEQLKSLDKDVLEIGSHTRSHAECSKLESESDFKSELGDSKSDLEGMTGYQIDHLCYPSGSCSGDVPDRLACNGYKTAVTTVPGFVDKNSQPYQLKRIGATADFALFKATVSGSALFLLQVNDFLQRWKRGDSQ